MLALLSFLWLFSSPACSCECGERQQDPASLQVRVYGGEEARPNEFPWAALVIIRNTSSRHHVSCGASLLTDRHLLTAAHCLEPGNIFVILGKSGEE